MYNVSNDSEIKNIASEIRKEKTIQIFIQKLINIVTKEENKGKTSSY